MKKNMPEFCRLRKKKKYVIDASLFTDKLSAHAAMRAVLADSEYYGSNLDALHDVLTSLRRDCTILILNFDAAAAALGEYAAGIRQVFTDSAAENPHLEIVFVSGEGKN